jgi:hypothetical protein
VACFALAGARPAPLDQEASTCEFTLNEPSVKQAAVTGTDGIKVPLHVMHQPDSPVEILTVDLTGYTFDVSQGSDGIYRSSERGRCKVTVRNRSNLSIRGFETAVGYNGFVWTQPGAASFNPGQQMELAAACGGGGSGHSKVPPSLVISVQRVEFPGCTYQPSMRFPRNIKGRLATE